MKRGKLLNVFGARWSRRWATPTDHRCDAGLPIPAGPERIDLALMAGTPALKPY